jgi:hypothetical protein
MQARRRERKEVPALHQVEFQQTAAVSHVEAWCLGEGKREQ